MSNDNSSNESTAAGALINPSDNKFTRWLTTVLSDLGKNGIFLALLFVVVLFEAVLFDVVPFEAVPEFAEQLGLDPADRFEVHELRRAMRVSSDGRYIPQVVVSLTQSTEVRQEGTPRHLFRGGSTLGTPPSPGRAPSSACWSARSPASGTTSTTCWSARRSSRTASTSPTPTR